LANVFLILKHTQNSRSFTSNNQSAIHFFDNNGHPQGFLIFWNINANAVSGEGVLTIAVRGPDSVIPIYKNSKKDAVKYDVKIDGQIDVTHTTFTSSDDTNKFVYLVSFELACKGKQLKGAQLAATIVSPNGEIQLPVSTNQNGYTVSYTLDNKNALSGDYRLKIERLDRQRGESTTLLDTVYQHKQHKSTSLPIKSEFGVAVALAVALYFLKKKV